MSDHAQKPWEKGPQLTASEVLHILNSNFPHLQATEVRRLGDGWDNTTWLINQQWAFRFPKHPTAHTLLNHELTILPELPKFDLEIPQPEFVARAPKHYPFCLYGHRYLTGTSIDHHDLSDDKRTQLARPLAQFLRKLHDFPIHQARAIGIAQDEFGRADFKSRRQETLDRFTYLVEHTNIAAKQPCLDFFRAYADQSVPENIVLAHGDLYAKHILLNEAHHPTAIIDWGDCQLMSPAVDLAVAFQVLPRQAQATFWAIYGKVTPEIKTLSQLRAIYSAITIAWYAHQVSDSHLHLEALNSLSRIAHNL
jgi:aminoglycoside phosphotransferase (APT) family kinase protein